MVSQVVRLWFHFMTYSRKDKHESGHFVKKESSRHQRKQQRYQNTQEQIIEKENKHRSWSSDVQRKPDGRRNHIIGRNPKEQHQRARSIRGTWERKWYTLRKISMFLIIREFKNKSYRKIMN